ncbi:MAG: FAD:protein FMN transferase [Thermoanaerobaculaceae bacterium]|nr:FAD:protein FMN transferase [Thermoanaerobaculaceae bacterium]MDI9621821.1 FAD:protein FMN transferase [Acidobacteriota bacterium]NLH34381.1 FAD:protein FMN transferase [Lentimicrobium sp.]HPW54464.1 FAD:protein FMN transferase [Thermoanaerobaculaceae bacterium]
MRRWLGISLVVAVTGVTVAALWVTQRDPRLVAVTAAPTRVMGTSCTLTAVVPLRRQEAARRAMHEAETVLRRTEAHMSTHLERSELSRLNAAGAGAIVHLSADTMAVLEAARRLHGETEGAFDATCRPLVELWRDAGRAGRLPEPPALLQARGRSRWDLFELRQDGVVKRTAGARVDLGGIAKGWGIDRAIEELERAGVRGALVEVGGDLRVVGTRPDRSPWSVDVRHPFAEGVVATLRLTNGAVATSGNYARFVTIDGRRYSHIVDPRSGWPAESTPSVTVVAPDALTADAWATALSVLGPWGLARLERRVDIHAMLVTGTPESCAVHTTVGFANLLSAPPRLGCLQAR